MATSSSGSVDVPVAVPAEEPNYFDDDLDEVLISFIPDDLVKSIQSGKHESLQLVNTDVTDEDFSKREIRKLELKLSQNELIKQTNKIMKNALQQMDADMSYFISPPDIVDARKKVIKLIERDLISTADTDNTEVLDDSNNIIPDAPYQTIIGELCEVVKRCESHCLLSEAKRSMWQEFYLYLSSKPSQGWKYLENLLVENEIDFVSEFDLFKFKLSYTIIEIIFSMNLKTYEDEHGGKAKSYDNEKLDERENNILKYVAGFVAYSLRKRFLRNPNRMNDKLSKSLENWTIKQYESKCFDFKDRWINLVNRGGLVDVNNKCFLFFRSVEYAVRRVFNVDILTNYAGENLKELITKQIFNNKHVIYCWDRLYETSKLEKDEKERLFKDVISYWISIRGRAFVRAWVDGMRKDYKDKVSKKGEHSHRKELNASSKK